MNRRALLISTIALAGLVACGAQTPAQLKTDANLISATATVLIGPVLLAKPGITAGDVNNINTAIASIQAGATLIAQGTDISTTAGKIAAAVNILQPIAVKYLPPTSQEGIAFNAMVTLLPLFLAAAGVTGAAPRPTGMTPDQARAIMAKYQTR